MPECNSADPSFWGTSEIKKLCTKCGQALETFKNRVYGACAVIGVLFAIVGWIYGGFFKNIADTPERIAACEVRVLNTEKTQDKLETKYETLRSGHEQLRRNITVLWDRQGKGPPYIVEALVLHGEIESISSKELILFPDDAGYPKLRFILPEGVHVSLNEKPIKIGELKAGMNADLLINRGKLQEIRAEQPKP